MSPPRQAQVTPPAVKNRAPCLQLAKQVLPLVFELARGTADPKAAADRAHLAAIEGVTTRLRLPQHRSQEGVDGRAREWVCLESMELRMVAVAPGFAAQDRARQQRFSPQRHEALRIKIFGMEGPESQAVLLLSRPGLPPVRFVTGA